MMQFDINTPLIQADLDKEWKTIRKLKKKSFKNRLKAHCKLSVFIVLALFIYISFLTFISPLEEVKNLDHFLMWLSCVSIVVVITANILLLGHYHQHSSSRCYRDGHTLFGIKYVILGKDTFCLEPINLNCFDSLLYKADQKTAVQRYIKTVNQEGRPLTFFEYEELLKYDAKKVALQDEESKKITLQTVLRQKEAA